MGARDSIGKAPSGNRLRTLHRAPLWLSDVLPEEARRTWPIVLPVAAAGAAMATAAVLALLHEKPGASTLAGVAGLLLASLLAETFPLPLEGVTVSTTSLAIVFIAATATIYGWAEAALVGLLTVALGEAKLRRPLTRAVFNTGVYVCSGAAAGLVAGRWSDGDLGSLVLAGFLGAAAFYAVNMLLLAAVIARVRATPYPQTLRRHVSTTALPFLVIAPLTRTLAVLS